MHEIDAIFRSKTTPNNLTERTPLSTPVPAQGTVKKSKNKKNKKSQQQLKKWAVSNVQVETIDHSTTASQKFAHIKPVDDDVFGETRSNARLKTDDGFQIYTDKELKIGEGEGDTKDCPFDCWCCF